MCFLGYAYFQRCGHMSITPVYCTLARVTDSPLYNAMNCPAGHQNVDHRDVDAYCGPDRQRCEPLQYMVRDHPSHHGGNAPNPVSQFAQTSAPPQPLNFVSVANLPPNLQQQLLHSQPTQQSSNHGGIPSSNPRALAVQPPVPHDGFQSQLRALQSQQAHVNAQRSAPWAPSNNSISQTTAGTTGRKRQAQEDRDDVYVEKDLPQKRTRGGRQPPMNTPPSTGTLRRSSRVRGPPPSYVEDTTSDPSSSQTPSPVKSVGRREQSSSLPKLIPKTLSNKIADYGRTIEAHRQRIPQLPLPALAPAPGLQPPAPAHFQEPTPEITGRTPVFPHPNDFPFGQLLQDPPPEVPGNLPLLPNLEDFQQGTSFDYGSSNNNLPLLSPPDAHAAAAGAAPFDADMTLNSDTNVHPDANENANATLNTTFDADLGFDYDLFEQSLFDNIFDQPRPDAATGA